MHFLGNCLPSYLYTIQINICLQAEYTITASLGLLSTKTENNGKQLALLRQSETKTTCQRPHSLTPLLIKCKKSRSQNVHFCDVIKNVV